MSIVVTALIAALTIAANAVVNLKIKFAPDQATASRDLKSLGLRLLSLVLNVAIAVNLYIQVVSAEPLTRHVVFDIALGVAVLLFSVTTFFMNRLMSLVGDLTQVAAQHAKSTKELLSRLPTGGEGHSGKHRVE